MENFINEAKEKGIITRAGAWYKYNDDNIGQGLDNTIARLEEDVELYNNISNDLNDSTSEVVEKVEETIEEPTIPTPQKPQTPVVEPLTNDSEVDVICGRHMEVFYVAQNKIDKFVLNGKGSKPSRPMTYGDIREAYATRPRMFEEFMIVVLDERVHEEMPELKLLYDKYYAIHELGWLSEEGYETRINSLERYELNTLVENAKNLYLEGKLVDIRVINFLCERAGIQADEFTRVID